MVLLVILLSTNSIIAVQSILPIEKRTYQLTTDSFSYSCPSWSPDGKRSIYSVKDGGRWVIESMDDKGGDKKPYPASAPDGWDFWPAWSNKTNKIAFLTNHSDPTGSNWIELWVMNADGTDRKAVIPDWISGMYDTTYNPIPLPWSKPTWNRDGTEIAFSKSWESLPGKYSYSIWACAADGTNLRNLTYSESSFDVAAAWSPDGSKIAFMSNRADNWDIWVINADGNNLRKLTTYSGDDFTPTWSSDSSQIAYVSKSGGSYNIWVIDSNGNEERQITNAPFSQFHPTWSPDGKRIAFVSDQPEGNVEKWHIWITDLSYPLGEIDSIDAPSKMVKGWSYNVSINVNNQASVKVDYTVSLSGNGFVFSPSETNVTIDENAVATVTFEVIPREEGNRSVTATLFQDGVKIDEKPRVIGIVLPANLEVDPQNIRKEGSAGNSFEETLVLRNKGATEAISIHIDKTGELAGWISIKPSIESIAGNEQEEIKMTLQIPNEKPPGIYTGSISFEGDNLEKIEVPIEVTVVAMIDYLPIITIIITAAIAAPAAIYYIIKIKKSKRKKE